MTDRLRIGATLSIADYYLPERLTQGDRLPARFSLAVGNTQRLTTLLMDGALACRGDAVTDFADVTEIGSFLAIKQLLGHMDAVSFMYEGVAKPEIDAGRLCRLRVTDLCIAHPLWFVRLTHHIDAARCDAFFASIVHQPANETV